jgi:type IV pilus assembly protein PilY1
MNSSISAASDTCLVARGRRRLRSSGIALLACGLALTVPSARAQTALADSPVLASLAVPGNVAFPLSVEWPTVQRTAHTDTTYASTNNYLGYFDPAKCYTYQNYATDDATNVNHFYPVRLATARTCGGTAWSGNFLNWAATPTIDPFRWAMTGGYRVVDTASSTILEKAWSGSQGSLFPDKAMSSSGSIAGATPLGFSSLTIRVDHLGNKMRFTKSGTIGNSGTNYNNPGSPSGSAVYEVYVRVKVCDSAVGAGGVEANCVKYGSNWKPEGLIQKYANQLRYSVFGYLNDSSSLRDGGVLRARQKFVGPTRPVPGAAAQSNTASEWDQTTGIFVGNPDTADATATTTAFTPSTAITNSGVMNYINKFGEITRGDYKSYDPVSELYYATLRYLKNKGNVPSYTDMSAGTVAQRTQWIDGFPVITNWDDPIQYACQRNFVLGIGDIYTWNDKNLPGSTSTLVEPAMPASVVPVSGDSSYTAAINAITATDKVFAMQGLTAPNRNSYSGRNNSAGMAGLAYDANTRDIRPDFAGTQTVQTYWVDVLEAPFVANNQYYLAAKYGGFKVPVGFDPYAASAALADTWWHTPVGSPDTNLVGTQLRPDNYYTGGRPDQLVAGLKAAFADIGTQLSAFTTAVSIALPQVAVSGNNSYSSKYDSATWTGEVDAADLSFDTTTGIPTKSPRWSFSAVLAAQLSGTGWNTNRRVVTWVGGATGVPLRATGTPSLAATAELAALDTSGVAGDDSANYLNYLRGDRSREVGCTGGTCAAAASLVYRARAKLLGDVVGSKARPVGPPSFPFSDATNPGYGTFKSTWASRRTVVYVGSNDGMMHAINGALVTTQPSPAPVPPLEQDADAGKEMFAYVPRALFQGPNSTPNTDGLASLGSATFAHHHLVNATPNVYDIDFKRTPGGSGATNWRSVLIGGLGKGGRAYYAMDVTDPQGMVTGGESAVAGKVLWEFSNSTTGMSGELGYTFGDPVVVKTRKYGWVLIFPSGYNNADGKGYFIFVNPRTGALLETVTTNEGSTTADAGLAHANGFVVDATDGTADSVYAGDLLGNLWRLDVTAASGSYPAPVKLAVLADAGGTAQPVTSRPSIEVHPRTKKRFVMVGTGRLLDATDIASTQEQTFYAFADGVNAAFNATGAPLTLPYSRSVLLNNNTAGPLRTDGSTFDPTSQAGWYEDLGLDLTTATPPHTGSGYGWRVVSESTTLSGSVAFPSIVPNNSVCSPAGDSRVYGRDYASGTTTVRELNAAGTQLVPVIYVSLTGSITDLRYLSVKGKATLISGTDTGSISKIEINPLTGLGLRRLNWRELQAVD